MDLEKVDKVVQYAIAVAAGEEFYNRELGPIHLVKYVYLADLAYAERNRGQTFTGSQWKFHHFGPWSLDVYKRLEPACSSVGAEKKSIPSAYREEDFIRWSLKDENLAELLEAKLPLTVTSEIKWAIRKFGIDTPSLLNHVYLTRPMLKAAPGEFLDFSLPEETGPVEEKESEKLSNKDQKRRSKILREAKTKIQQRLAEKGKTAKTEFSIRVPRYDEIFFAGCEWLYSFSAEKIEEFKGEASFSPEIWKSRTRFDPELP